MTSPQDKDRIKVLRGIAEGIVLIILLAIIIRAFLSINKYKHYDKNNDAIVTGEDKGFIGISYLAVGRNSSETTIGVKRLNEQLKALYDNGYVTITQADIENYYKNNEPLPNKALFLMFEDGRTDTSIFAQTIMERYNFKATMLSYGDKIDIRDKKFLRAKDLINMEKSTFWELGTNGYRLSYINVFDRYKNYLGELSSVEYNKIRSYLDRDYNQYLMDYIRDKDFIPKESYSQMAERISGDYDLMKDIYSKKIGKVPRLYALMHANTGSFGNNAKVSEVNENCIKNDFVMNFNREGYSLNNRKSSIYDLTRMQPQAYWYPNHLFMRIKDDTKADVTFVPGDKNKEKSWETVHGAAEYKNSIIALTSESEGSGLLRLKDSNYQNLKLSVDLTGNKLGSQAILLRADKDLKQYVSVKLQNNIIFLTENGKELLKLDLDEFDGIKKQSVEENEKEARTAEYELYKKNTGFGRTTDMVAQSDYYETAKTVEEGAKEYIPPIQINESGKRKVEIILKDDKINLFIDGKQAAKDIALSGSTAGNVYLESAWGEYGYSQRNIADDVYDGVFENLKITDINGSTVYYDDQLKGFDKVKEEAHDVWESILDWFINTF